MCVYSINSLLNDHMAISRYIQTHSRLTHDRPHRRQRVSSVGGSESGGADLSESAALRETRATYLPAVGEVPDWEKEEAALAFLDEEGEGVRKKKGSWGAAAGVCACVVWFCWGVGGEGMGL
jgi:hypothetical protein